MLRLKRLAAVCAIGAGLWQGTASAMVSGDGQPAAALRQAESAAGSFADPLKEGRMVHVVTADGQETTGRVVETTPFALVVAQHGVRREIPLVRVHRIQVPDSMWTGALVGAGFGAAMSLTMRTDSVCPVATPECSSQLRAARASFPVTLGLIGLGLDRLHTGWETFYEARSQAAAGQASRRRDPLFDGALIGAAAGAGAGVAYAHAVRDSDLAVGQYAYAALVFGGLGAAAGLGVDALFEHHADAVRLPRGLTLGAVAVRRARGIRAVVRW